MWFVVTFTDMQKMLVAIIILILLAGGVYFYYQNQGNANIAQNPATNTTAVPQATTTIETPVHKDQEAIGTSVDGHDITAYHFGSGTKELLFVGGIHGGYEWNTVLVAYQLMDYLKANPSAIPAGVKVTVIPVVNPDGLNKVVGTTTRFAASDVAKQQSVQISGRFNSHTVDLNRNFDCDWKASGTWQNTTVDGGSAAFSEPESQAVKKYVETSNPAAVVVWYSSAGGVYASNCHDGVLPETIAISDIYAKASKYPAHANFDFYQITGDMVNWLAKQKIPAFSVLLSNHTDTEWDKNKAGIDALLQYYAQ